MSDLENEAYTLARAKKEADQEAHQRYQRTVEKAKNLWVMLWGLIAMCMAGAVWTTTMQLTVNGHRKDIDLLAVRAERMEIKADTYIASNNLAMLNLTNLASGLKSTIDENRADLKQMRPHVEQMWWMKEQGLSNKDVARPGTP